MAGKTEEKNNKQSNWEESSYDGDLDKIYTAEELLNEPSALTAPALIMT